MNSANLISWNIRGLGNPLKKRAVKRLCSKGNVSVILLKETKIQCYKGNLVRSLWGSRLGGFSFAPSMGHSGGLISIWNPSIFFAVDKELRSQRFIILVGELCRWKVKACLVNVYTPNDLVERKNFFI
ncbi:hypothetical protein HRI_000313000 [Hibiscus trionum]|uniref:Endonuclease/exonuclease/phosphatase domain-containing protein n=1 Tax=Hibiscus trionum TaxID=183268 RepID=A0A9W7LJC2_HIBTR|nr:hypothetical protein HRI_000313000 [Hibiscus trionum]